MSIDDEIDALLNSRAKARWTDPRTSHEASTNMQGLRNDRLEILEVHLINYETGLTDFELTPEMSRNRQLNSISTRRHDLIKITRRRNGKWVTMQLDWLEDTGLEKPSPTRSKCIVWRITEKGVRVYERLMERFPDCITEPKWENKKF